MKNRKKERIYSLLTIIIGGLFLLSGCTSSKLCSYPDCLYKTSEGREIAYKSYDKAMGLWPVDYSEEYIETDYGKTHIIICGSEDGQPVYYVPGLFADATMWFANVKEIAKTYKVYVLDIPLYGGKCQLSKPIEDVADCYQWFNQIMQNYNHDKVGYIGLSYSSWMGLALARENPELFSSLILLDPSESFTKMDGGIAWKGFKAFVWFPDREKYAGFFDWIGGGYSNPQMDIWSEHMLDVIEFGATNMMEVPQHRIYTQEELAIVDIPVLIMIGGKPILYKDPDAFVTAAKKALPHAEVVVVPDTGHGLNMEKPDVVNARMLRFLDEVSR